MRKAPPKVGCWYIADSGFPFYIDSELPRGRNGGRRFDSWYKAQFISPVRCTLNEECTWGKHVWDEESYRSVRAQLEGCWPITRRIRPTKKLVEELVRAKLKEALDA